MPCKKGRELHHDVGGSCTGCCFVLLLMHGDRISITINSIRSTDMGALRVDAKYAAGMTVLHAKRFLEESVEG